MGAPPPSSRSSYGRRPYLLRFPQRQPCPHLLNQIIQIRARLLSGQSTTHAPWYTPESAKSLGMFTSRHSPSRFQLVDSGKNTTLSPAQLRTSKDLPTSLRTTDSASQISMFCAYDPYLEDAVKPQAWMQNVTILYVPVWCFRKVSDRVEVSMQGFGPS